VGSERLSFVQGLGIEPLKFETVGQALSTAAECWGDRDALIVPQQNVRWSWSELNRRAEHYAAAFIALGLRPGERLGIWAPNRAEWAVTQFAAAKAGLILVNLNPAYRIAELKFALNKVGCRALITAASFKTSDYLAMIAGLIPEVARSVPGELQAEMAPSLQCLIRLGRGHTPGFLSFDELPERANPQHRAAVQKLSGLIQPDEPANIQFTSGTTGSPKGATLSHFNILNNGYFVGRAMRLTERDRLCIPVPLYHCFGMVMGNLACVSSGAAMIYPGEGFDPRATLESVAREHATVLYGVPTMFIAELEQADLRSFDLSSLRTGIMAGAPCPISVMQRVMSEMHMAEVTIAYGMTETSPVSFQSAVDDPIERRVSSVGRIHPHLQVKVIDAEGRVVPRGIEGELCTRGYSVMQGYWDDEVQTRAAIDASGWMHTGDLGTLDAEGYCNITGRLQDLIVRGGENLSPREIEEFLYRHPKVQAVQVFGVPDHRYGEEVCTWIQLRAGQSATEIEIQEFCRGQIAHQKIPRYIRFVSQYPMTVTGKVQKFVMREHMIKELNLTCEKTA
jgi:fatty-acyl-CoA synthase